MPTNAPPFRADHVGSLLRPAEVKAARAARAAGSLDAAGLTAIEDAAIKRMIARQEEVGLEAVTDGELRALSWHWDFLGGLEGVERTRALAGVQFKGIVTQPTGLKVVGKLGFGRHPMLDHFAFVKRNTRAVAKMCIPSPTHMAGTTRDWRTVVGPATSMPGSSRCSPIWRWSIGRHSLPLQTRVAPISRSTTAISPSCAIPR